MPRESMVFYRSFIDALEELPAEEFKEVMLALTKYAMDDVMPELKGVAKMAFTLIKPQIDANNKRAENGKKGAEYGKLGGRPRKNPIGDKPKTPNVNVNVNENVNVNNNAPKPKNKFCDFPSVYTAEDIAKMKERVFLN